jgi:hypothetical protein
LDLPSVGRLSIVVNVDGDPGVRFHGLRQVDGEQV